MLNQLLLVYNVQKRLKYRLIYHTDITVDYYYNIALKECFFFTKKSTESQRNINAIKFEHLRPEVVLSKENRKSFIEKFKNGIIPERYDSKRIDNNTTQAAVLIPLCTNKGELGFIYTLRSTKVTANRGQVSFPGGMYDKKDSNLEETALRETWEELKIPKKKIDIWTSGNIFDKQNVKVLPVFSYVGEIDPEKLQINTDEVEEAFFFSLRNLCDLSLCRFTHFRDSYTLPVYLGGKYRVWGFTAALTHMVLSALVPDIYKLEFISLPKILPQKKE